MPDYGRSPYPFNSTNQLGVAYIRVEVDAARKISSKQYWNHAAGGWEDGPRDDAKHILKLERLADGTDAENTIQCFWALSGQDSPLASNNVITVVYTLDSGGVATAVPIDPFSSPYIKVSSGQNY